MIYLAKKDGERLKDSRGRRMCAVRSEVRMFGPSHSLCEIDDVLIHILCYELKKPVLTNDLELRRNVTSGISPFPVSKPMRLLMKHTQSTLLVSRAGHFVPAQRSKHVRGRTTKKRTRQSRMYTKHKPPTSHTLMQNELKQVFIDLIIWLNKEKQNKML